MVGKKKAENKSPVVYCRKCGLASYEGEAKFCIKCGFDLYGGKPVQTETKPENELNSRSERLAEYYAPAKARDPVAELMEELVEKMRMAKENGGEQFFKKE